MYVRLYIQVEGIMNEFQTNWSAFERIHADFYLSQLKVKQQLPFIDYRSSYFSIWSREGIVIIQLN